MQWLLAFLILTMTSVGYAADGTTSECEGEFNVCDNSTGICTKEYFYIYAHQYADVYDDIVKSESHSFSFSGILGDKDSYKLEPRARGPHLIYVGKTFNLAIPYKDAKDGVYMSQGVAGPSAGWVRLCK